MIWDYGFTLLQACIKPDFYSDEIGYRSVGAHKALDFVMVIDSQ